MDLLQTVRKEGSRGGRSEFKWEDVKGSQHRENYLGHSLMAPVGRWQKNKDLSWYAKKDANGKEISEADARKEELRRIKEAEADAMARALGLEVPSRLSDNPNMTALGGDKEVQQAVKESIEDVDQDKQDASKGLGYGIYGGAQTGDGDNDEVMAGTRMEHMEPNRSQVAIRRREGDKERNRRTEGEERRKRHRSRSRDGENRRDHYHRRNRSGERKHRHEHDLQTRSRSPYKKHSSKERRDHENHARNDRHRDYDEGRSRYEDRRYRRRSPDPPSVRNRRRDNATDNY